MGNIEQQVLLEATVKASLVTGGFLPTGDNNDKGCLEV